MLNLLAGVGPEAVRAEPFPHLLIENVLPGELCDHLIRELPSMDTVLKGAAKQENARTDYGLVDVRRRGAVSDNWRALMEANASQEFYQDAVRVFGTHIARLYPQLMDGDRLRRLRTGVRHIDTYADRDILLDSQIALNTPFKTNRSSSVRTAHVDNPKKLFAGLLYFRTPEDDSAGGSLMLCRWKNGVKREFTGPHIAMNLIQEVQEIPYRANTLVMFLNSLDAVHSVTRRMPTRHPRWFLNLLGQLEKPLFDLTSYQENPMRKLVRNALGAMHISLGGVEVRK